VNSVVRIVACHWVRPIHAHADDEYQGNPNVPFFYVCEGMSEAPTAVGGSYVYVGDALKMPMVQFILLMGVSSICRQLKPGAGHPSNLGLKRIDSEVEGVPGGGTVFPGKSKLHQTKVNPKPQG
jgi:hypothetical protein